MIDILRDIYFVHYNFFAVAILLLLLLIFFITKKNTKAVIVTVIVFVAFNIMLYNNTANMAWERQFFVDDEMTTNIAVWDKMVDVKDTVLFTDSMKVTFAANSKKYKWVVYDSKDSKKAYHWCWFDDFWEKVSQTDLVAAIWGENSGKKVRQSSETRLNGSIE